MLTWFLGILNQQGWSERFDLKYSYYYREMFDNWNNCVEYENGFKAKLESFWFIKQDNHLPMRNKYKFM